jgi:hypothetical protein
MGLKRLQLALLPGLLTPFIFSTLQYFVNPPRPKL